MNLRKISILLVLCLLPIGLQFKGDDVQATTGTVVGIVFNDKNSNGTNDGTDAGVSGVVVTAYDSSGAQVGTATTSGNGTYSLNVSSAATNNVRIEFTTPNGYQPSFQGADNATSIQFVSIPATNVNYAVHQPGQFCANNNVDPLVASVCIRPGPVNGMATNNNTLTSTSWSNRSAVNQMLNHVQTGSTWGVAQDPGTGLVWTSAVLRRHSGLGPQGLGGLYVTGVNGGNLISSFDLSLLVDQSSNPILFSSNPNSYTDTARGLSTSTPLSIDLAGYEGVGKVGIGDIDITADGFLWVTNVYENTILKIKIEGTAEQPALGVVQEYAVPQLSATTCNTNGTSITANIAHPWALKHNSMNNRMYVGIVCGRESNTVAKESPMTTEGSGIAGAAIIELDPAGAGTWTRVQSINLSGPRFVEPFCNDSSLQQQYAQFNYEPDGCKVVKWKGWTNNHAAIAAIPETTSSNNIAYPQPILSDIEILSDGSFVVGLMDRFTMQMGANNIRPTEMSVTLPWQGSLFEANVTGDTVLLCKTGATTWVQEASTTLSDSQQAGGCVGVTTVGGQTHQSAPRPFLGTFVNQDYQPSNKGYLQFFDDNVCAGSQRLDGLTWMRDICSQVVLINHLQTSQGGLAVWPLSGAQELVTSAMDPDNSVYTGGVRWYDTANGDTKWGTVFTVGSDDATVSFRKSASMGDVEILCDQAPVQIGNRVWIDTNGNGIQDPEETPVAGVAVRLYDTAGTTLLGTAVTNAQGQYYFSSNLTEAAAGNGDHLGGGLTAGQSYKIRLDRPEDYAAGGPLSGYQLTQATATSPATSLDTSVDSNATTVSNYPEIAVAAVFVGVNNHTYDVGFVQAPKVSVGNFVWIDSDADGIQDQGEPGLAGAILTLTNMSGNPVTNVLGQVVGSQTTASNGAYLFENLPPGQYKVNITYPAGYQATTAGAGSDLAVDSSTDTATSVNLPNNGDADVTLDFGVVVTPSPSPSDNPEPSPSSTTTTTTTTPVQNANVIKVSVGDYVWWDLDRDGIQDSSEKGIPNVTLSIRKAEGSSVVDVNGMAVTTTKTDGNGKYSFDSLPPGQYKVSVVSPRGYLPTLAQSRPNVSRDSSTGFALSVNLTIDGQRDPTLDFGFYKPSKNESVAVGNLVWDDRNRDGLQGSGASGVSGAVLILEDKRGLPVRDIFNRLVRSQTTKADGKYLFRNLSPGQYVVRIRYPKNYFATTSNKSNQSLNSSTFKAFSKVLRGGQYDLTLDFGVVYRPGIQILPATR
jgi:protocatechuate 3,4-dioxygenase beta subunit